ncbi:MAG TPA: DNA-3-methyladenine glycosylase [Chthoniobacterales bacterium]
MISADFFQSDPLICAPGLVGTTLVWGRCAGVIVETEAYLAQGDEAAHTFTRPSARAFIERNRAGAAYVYFNYGVHWMLNVLVKGGRADGFVLVRALEPRRGISLMRKRRGLDDLTRLCSGPGKLTQALEITGRDHEKDLCVNSNRCFLPRPEDVEVVADARIGITRSAHLPWRFTLRGSPFVSRRVKSA